VSLAQGVVVENKTGANALIATQEVKRAAPDGYTILMTTLSHNVNAILLADKKPYDPIRDFAPISLVAFLPLVMVTRAMRRSTRSRTSCRRRGRSRARCRTPRPGTAARRTSPLRWSRRFGREDDARPFRGNAPALTEVMAGRVNFMFYPMVGIAEQVAQSRLKALASAPRRGMPIIRTPPQWRRAVLRGFEQYTQGLGVVAPAGTPAPVIDKLNAAVRASLCKAGDEREAEKLGATTEGAARRRSSVPGCRAMPTRGRADQATGVRAE